MRTKNILIAIIVAVTANLGMTCSAQEMSTKEIDKVYSQTPFLQNELSAEEQKITYDVKNQISISCFSSPGINMVVMNPPMFMDSQQQSVQLVVNGRQEFDIPVIFSYQAYEFPKMVNGKFVIRVKIGMSDPRNRHFYVVVDPNGSDHYFTKVVSS